ncbi:histidinol-phosphatase HisJ [Microscilla marina]|uniref:Histidinol-phosphatase n=1 Tax=Microscilla marina ATCC 23134 TaxID=313606 RepID=A1ZCF2_MICM2|nr:histidinol-phosphatase HisJ [Microscilla marina]EAY31954.1 putative histidinol-phosphatase [Microscilla marina ATCC 23134]
MYWANYHSHCRYCDGSHSPTAYIAAAIEQNVKAYGFSSHAPLPFASQWAMSFEDVLTYFKEIHLLKAKHATQLQVYTSFELDYISSNFVSPKQWAQAFKVDYLIGSVHFIDTFANGQYWEIDSTTQVFKHGLELIFKGNVREAIQRYYALTRAMVQQQVPDVVGHLDKVKIHNRNEFFFDEGETWYQQEVQKTLETIAKCGQIMEVNTRGLYKKQAKETYPSTWVLERAHELGLPIMLNSDAHHPSDITKEFGSTAKLLQDIGFKQLQVFWDGQWQGRSFDHTGIDIG